MKSILLCIAFSIFSICTIAQEAQQSVELKDGSIVVGEILKKYDNGSVKINTAFGIVILSADTIAEIRDSVTPLRKDTATARLPIQYQPVIQQTQDKELRTHIEAYRKTLATGYTLEVAGIALLIGGSFVLASDSQSVVGTGLVVAGTALSIGGIVTIWTSPSKLRLSTNGANLMLSF